MYNRYIPQPDGSYLRNRIPDPTPPPPPPSAPRMQKPDCIPVPEPPPCPQDSPVTPASHQRRTTKQHSPASRPSHQKQETGSVSGFLKQLIPKDFETADLLVVLLLLLMSGDNSEDQNTALLTLALYLFL